MDGSISDKVDKKPHIIPDDFQDFTAEEILKYRKYEADYARRLRAKYFSNKNIFGADIFDLIVPVGSETIKAGRWSPTRSYADPAGSFEEPVIVMASGSETPSVSKTPLSVANGNDCKYRVCRFHDMKVFENLCIGFLCDTCCSTDGMLSTSSTDIGGLNRRSILYLKERMEVLRVMSSCFFP